MLTMLKITACPRPQASLTFPKIVNMELKMHVTAIGNAKVWCARVMVYGLNANLQRRSEPAADTHPDHNGWWVYGDDEFSAVGVRGVLHVVHECIVAAHAAQGERCDMALAQLLRREASVRVMLSTGNGRYELRGNYACDGGAKVYEYSAFISNHGDDAAPDAAPDPLPNRKPIRSLPHKPDNDNADA